MDTATESPMPQVTAEDVKKAIDGKEPCILLDVRTPEEYAREKIKESINIPVHRIRDDVENLLPDKNQIIYVYCLSGSRSMHAASVMLKLGYNKVFDLKQGLLAWRAYSYPFIS